MSQRAYADLGEGQQTHYRHRGSGTPLVLLHPSPLSSVFMEPVMQALPDNLLLIAPDTPGYGSSDPLPEAPTDLGGYVSWLRQFMKVLGHRRFALYGSATGAQIAIEFARTWPDCTLFVLLDNAAHFTAAEREAMLARYFPDLSPRTDGSHLRTAWDMISALWQWFPWYQQDEEHRVGQPRAMPPELLQAMLIDHLRAGADYDRAYRAAMANEDASRLLEVTVPVRVIRWQGSILRRYAARYDDFDWPPHIRMVHCGPEPEQRLAAIREQSAQLLRSGDPEAGERY